MTYDDIIRYMAYGTWFPLFKCDRDICDDIYIYLFIVVYIHITYMCLYLYKHRVYLKFLQGSLSSSLELVGCLGDACRNFPCHHEGGCSFLGSFLGEEKLPSEAEGRLGAAV